MPPGFGRHRVARTNLERRGVTTATKVDFKRERRDLYAPKRSPVLVEVPEFVFLMVDGRGDPNESESFQEAVSALFTLSYTAKFALKGSGVIDYGVMPLEGLWWGPDMSRFSIEQKDEWSWTAMIRQPEELTRVVLARAKTEAAKKSPAGLDRVRLERFKEGLAAQVLHLGPYSGEGPTIERLHAFIAEQGYALAGKHHEIYLGDPRRAAPEKLKTIIRQPVRAAD